MKKGSSDKNLYIYIYILLGVRKSLFHSSMLKDTRVMTLCLCHVETVIHNWFFFTDFASVRNEEEPNKEKRTQ